MFQYIPEVILTSESLTDHFDSVYLPCKCEEVCDESCSCHHGSSISYQNGVLTEDFLSGIPRPIIECSDLCTCNKNCPNRVVQHGIKLKLQIFMTEFKGFGVRTLEFIPKNTFISEYAGELIDEDESYKRTKNNPPGIPVYIYTTLEYCSDGNIITTIIDPSEFGNVSRYLNHSCSPNVFAQPVRVDCVLPRICFFAKRDILPYEELTYNYCSRIDAKKVFNIPDGVLRECLCESPQCKGYVPLDVKYPPEK